MIKREDVKPVPLIPGKEQKEKVVMKYGG